MHEGTRYSKEPVMGIDCYDTFVDKIQLSRFYVMQNQRTRFSIPIDGIWTFDKEPPTYPLHLG